MKVFRSAYYLKKTTSLRHYSYKWSYVSGPSDIPLIGKTLGTVSNKMLSNLTIFDHKHFMHKFQWPSILVHFLMLPYYFINDLFSMKMVVVKNNQSIIISSVIIIFDFCFR